MIKVPIYIESRYKVNRKRIKKAVETVLAEQNVSSYVEISVAIIGDRKMKSLNKKYRNLDKTTNVLSFPLQELHSSDYSSESEQQDGVARLGDIVLSYPQVIKESVRDDMLVDDKVDQLVKHSMLHLLGIHHQ